MTLLAGLDPGSKPAYVLCDTQQCLSRRYFREPLPLVIAVALARPAWITRAPIIGTELQWLRKRARKGSILTLSFSAGWQLARACAHGAVPCALPVAAQHAGDMGWRDVLGIPGSIPKEVACRRCRDSLTPAETRLALSSGASPKRLLDVYDAIMIAWATFLSPTQYQEPP